MKLTEFNEGGLHHQNPNGGIPVGNNNTVEQGETKIGNFVYSNRLFIDENLPKQMNLPNYIKNKSFADASKAINNKFKDRNDKPSLETKKILLERLANVQEILKQQKEQEAQKINEALKINSTQTPDMMSGQVPQGMEQFLPQQNQMFLGGKTEDPSIDVTSVINGGVQALNSLSTGDTDKAGIDVLKTAGSVGLNALVPGLGMAASPVIDTVSNLINNISGRKQMARQRRNDAFKASNQFTNDFAKGGNLRPWELPVSTIEDDPNYNNPLFKTPSIPEVNATSFVRPQLSAISMNPINSTIKPTTSLTNINPFNSAKLTTKTTNTNVLNKVGDFLDKNGANMLRYSPIATNAYQLSKLKKPNYERLDRLNNVYKPTFVDEKNIQNIVSNENENTINALTNSSNGSVGTLRSNILGANLNAIKGMSDAYLKSSELNNSQKQYKQQFDLGVNQANIAQSNAELDINDRNKANYDTQKSKFLGQIGSDLGEIGKEEIFKKQAEKITGYSWMGDFLNKNPNYKAQFDAIMKDPSLDDNTKRAKAKALADSVYKGFDQNLMNLANNSASLVGSYGLPTKK